MVATDSPKQLLTEVLAVQTRRAELYNQFDRGFKRYLETKQDGIYRQLVSYLTQNFSACSMEIKGIEAKFRGQLARPELADILQSLQDNEKEKLNLTVSLQALKTSYSNKQFSWQQDDAHGPHGPHHMGHCCSGHDADGDTDGAGRATEPTEREYNAAVTEAIQKLQVVVTYINDLLEEIRYALDDMQ